MQNIYIFYVLHRGFTSDQIVIKANKLALDQVKISSDK